MNELWKLAVRDEFSAGHALRHYEGKCEKLHGHNFFVEITICGKKLDEKTGLLLDFKILKGILKNVLKNLDHSVLNENSPFDVINPSSENLSKLIWNNFAEELEKRPEKNNAFLYSVTVAERDSQSATYYGRGMNFQC